MVCNEIHQILKYKVISNVVLSLDIEISSQVNRTPNRYQPVWGTFLNDEFYDICITVLYEMPYVLHRTIYHKISHTTKIYIELTYIFYWVSILIKNVIL